MKTITEMLDDFEAKGPEIEGTRGKHHCLITTLARMDISEAREAGTRRLFQLDVARALATQLIQAVTFMHSRGVIHGGKWYRYFYIPYLLLMCPRSS
jgi:serine/threonine-protein kinase SRPK3